MATPNQNLPDVLSEEILAEAETRVRRNPPPRAAVNRKLLLAAAKAEAEKIRRRKMDSAQAEAARRSELILATDSCGNRPAAFRAHRGHP